MWKGELINGLFGKVYVNGLFGKVSSLRQKRWSFSLFAADMTVAIDWPHSVVFRLNWKNEMAAPIKVSIDQSQEALQLQVGDTNIREEESTCELLWERAQQDEKLGFGASSANT